MQRITLELSDEALLVLDDLARPYLKRQELGLLQWLNQTPEGRAYWAELNSNQALLVSSSSRELNSLLMKKFREHCPAVMGRPAIAKARSAALKALLMAGKQEAA